MTFSGKACSSAALKMDYSFSLLVLVVLELQKMSLVVCYPEHTRPKPLTVPETLAAIPYRDLQRQFIGSSVIGGLMWPVLFTLALTAMAARVPPFFRNIFQAIRGGSGGGGQSVREYDLRLGLLGNSLESIILERRLEETLRIFERMVEQHESDA